MIRRLKKCLYLLPLLFIPFTPAMATNDLLFEDTFTSTQNVDLNTTTAWVDTSNGWVECWHPNQAQVMAAQGTTIPQSIVVATSTGVQWYSYDQATGKMTNNTSLQMNYTNPLGLSFVPQSMSYFVLSNNGGQQQIKKAVFDGTGMVDDPLVSVTGLSNLVSISSVSSDTAAVADQQGKIQVYTQGALDSTHSFNTGLTNIKTVLNVPGTWDFIVVTSGGSYRYSWNQATGAYIQNSTYSITTGSQTIVSGGMADNGNLVDFLTASSNSGYEFNQSSGQMNASNLYTIGPLTDAIGVSLPSSQSVVLATKDGTVHTYKYDSTANQMVEDPNMAITGLTFSKDYKSPSLYQSQPITPSSPNNMFEVIPTEQNNPGTSISYGLSVDGGSTFTNVQPSTWVHLPAGTFNPPSGANVPSGPYVLQATLTSPSGDATPRLTDIQLHGYLDVTPPTAPGTPSIPGGMSGYKDTTITWIDSSDPINPPSTGSSGLATYQIRFSTDGGNTWGSWIPTNSTQPQYTLSVPDHTVINEQVQVRALDNAGNMGPASSTGQIFIDTNPLGVSGINVINILNPTDGQTYPTNQLPVHVKAGGEVVYMVTTTGAAQDVEVTYSDGQTQTLVPQNPLSTPSDTNQWEGFYYPSSSSTIPLDTPQGTNIKITQIKVTGWNKTPYTTSSDLLIVDGSISSGNLPNMIPYLIH